MCFALKKQHVVIAAVLHIWVATFGAPRQISSVNGGEFSNDDFRKMGKKLNRAIKSTTAESPWSNGINERHNAILADMVKNIKEDTNCSLQVALFGLYLQKMPLQMFMVIHLTSWILAKTEIFHRFFTTSCHVLIFSMPGIPQAFISAESCEKIRRALQAKAWRFNNGDSVYYKRDVVLTWKGPGTVISKEGQTVLVKHGSIQCNICQSASQ